jgi:sialate O-acetylesterase
MTCMKLFLAVLALAICNTAEAALKLPSFISDSMVLQRNIKVPVWGWASAGSAVSISFHGKTYQAVTDANGKWMVKLSPMTAGGPFDMTIKGDGQTVMIKNILIGDVWVCSGQSNMQFDFNGVRTLYAKEIAASANNNIRLITFSRVPASNPQTDIKNTGWKAASPQNILNFSAAGYFFGKELNEKYGVPIGLINTNYGGTHAEAWTSEEGLQQFPQFVPGLQFLHDTAAVNKRMQAFREKQNEWHARTKAVADILDSNWRSMELPSLWDDHGYKNTFGVILYRKTIDVPEAMVGKEAILQLGCVDDEDESFINDIRVGGFANRGMPRRHPIAAGVLKPGKNIITVRVINWDNRGGFAGDMPMEIQSANGSIALNGNWEYKQVLKLPQRPGGWLPNNLPTALYNSMIAPLIPYAIKGVIWYQGEGNATRAYEYRSLFPAMIADWRKQWGQGNFPFVFQQLVNFRAVKKDHSNSDWAELREAQFKTLSVPNTAMSVGIDVGEEKDIHPLNKKDIGHRLALGAERIAYGDKKIVSSGPLYSSMKKQGNKIIIHFTNTGSGLFTKDGAAPNWFAIAGADQKFEWGKAVIKGNTVEVWSEAITGPVAVRYAWADNPEGCNLVNKEGLPASPFRTDSWPGVTDTVKYTFR